MGLVMQILASSIPAAGIDLFLHPGYLSGAPELNELRVLTKFFTRSAVAQAGGEELLVEVPSDDPSGARLQTSEDLLASSAQVAEFQKAGLDTSGVLEAGEKNGPSTRNTGEAAIWILIIAGLVLGSRILPARIRSSWVSRWTFLLVLLIVGVAIFIPELRPYLQEYWLE